MRIRVDMILELQRAHHILEDFVCQQVEKAKTPVEREALLPQMGAVDSFGRHVNELMRTEITVKG